MQNRMLGHTDTGMLRWTKGLEASCNSIAPSMIASTMARAETGISKQDPDEQMRALWQRDKQETSTCTKMLPAVES